MHRTWPTRVASGVLAMAAGLVLAAPAFGLILFPTDVSPPPVRPNDDVMGRWNEPSGNFKASCVAIAPSYVVTTRHQGGGVGYSVTIGGNTYPVLEVFEDSGVDIRIARIGANLTYYIAPFAAATVDAEKGKSVVLGGYGRPRGAALMNGALTYGYEWAAADQVLRWGTNTIDSLSTGTYGGLTSDVVVAHFNYSIQPNHEAAIAEFDSGGGWFIDVSADQTGDWRLAGLSRFAEHGGQTWYRSPTGLSDPDFFDAVRVGSYAGWLKGVINPSTWVGGSGAWSADAQWSPAGRPDAADAWAVFGDRGPGALAVTLDQAVTVGTLRFDGATDYTLGGPRALTFRVTSGAAGIEVNRLLDPSGTGAPTIAAALALDANLTVNHSSAGLLTLSGVVSGNGSLTKDKSGTLVLANTNTYCGGTVLKAGTLRATAPGAFGAGQIALAGGVLEVRQDASVSFPNSVLMSGDTTLYVDRSASGAGRTVTFGPLTVGGDWKLTAKGASGYGLAFSGATSFMGTIGATIETATADVALSGGVSVLRGTLTKTGPKALTIAGPQVWGAGTVFDVRGGTVRLNADTGASALFNVTLGATGADARVEFGSTQHLAALNLNGGARASLAAGGGKTLVTSKIAIDEAGSALDIADNNLILVYCGASPLDQVKGLIRTGFNAAKWTGNGITSSEAKANPAVFGIGYAQNDQLFAPFKCFGGEPVGKDTILARLTYAGDVNLDGAVDDIDVAILGMFYDGGAKGGHYWSEGDIWGYDGLVDDGDVSLLGLNYGSGIGQPLGGSGGAYLWGTSDSWTLPEAAPAPSGGSAVPEPATLLLLALGGVGLMSRRARRRA